MGSWMQRPLWRPVIVATLLCGTLDILFAIILTLLNGKSPAAMLRFVASGPFPSASNWGAAGSLVGLAVHYSLMAIMVVAFVAAARSIPTLTDRPIGWGIAYGIATYVMLDLLILPMRFAAAWPPRPISIGTQLFAHIVLVGIPTALIARRHLRG